MLHIDGAPKTLLYTFDLALIKAGTNRRGQ